MRVSNHGLVLIGLIGLCQTPVTAKAQAVAFAPQVSSLPDGVGLSATPVVSSDRRYVRLSLGVGFQTVNGITNFPIPAAVSNGGNGRGVGGLTGMNGPVGSGFNTYGSAEPWLQDLGAWSPAPTRAKTSRAKTVRSKKPLPEPTIARAKGKP